MRWAVVSLLLFLSDGESPALRDSPLAQSLFELAHDANGADDPSSRAELVRIAAIARGAARLDPDAAPARLLNRTVFDVVGFVREVDDANVAFALLPSVLKTRRGNCVGLGTLYLALGEMLGWKVEAVMMPGHFFVRVEGSSVELLRRGESMPDSWYAARFPPPGGGAAEYARPLRSSEVLGIVEYDIGNERRRQGRLREARGAYERASVHFPGLAEAHASLGATLHLLGSLDDAAASYRTARQVNPYLPGLDHNIELLERERRGDALR